MDNNPSASSPRDPRGFILLLLLFFLISNQSNQPLVADPRAWYNRVIAREKTALEALDASRWGDFGGSVAGGVGDKWLNVTGLREQDGFAWGLLDGVRERVRGQCVRYLGERGTRAWDGDDGIREGGKREDKGKEKKRKEAVVGEEGPLVLYQNVSGYVQGEWVRSPVGRDVRAPVLNITELLPDSLFTTRFDRNVSISSGNVRFHFTERQSDGRTKIKEKGKGKPEHGSVVPIKARMFMSNEKSFSNNFDMTLYGVHFPRIGGLILTTTSEKFGGIFALPHFALSERTFNISRDFLVPSINDTIQRQIAWPIAGSNPWSSAADGASENMFTEPHCEYIVYLQQHEVSFPAFSTQDRKRDHYLLGLVEKELRFPKGLSAPPPSSLAMSMVAFSPDCGFVLESKGPPDYSPVDGKHLIGMKVELAIERERKTTLLFGALMAASVYLLKKQMQEASTPSTRSRISFYTITMMAMADGFLFFVFLIDSLISRSFLLALYVVGYLACLSGALFGMRFLMDIWAVQATERRRQERQRQEAVSAATPTTATGAEPATPNTTTSRAPPTTIQPRTDGGLPLPVTARSNNTREAPIILLSDQDTLDDGLDVAATTPAANNRDPGSINPQDFRSLYFRIVLCIFMTLFISLHSLTWPTPFRAAFINTLCFIYLSFWTPQIYRNIMRNCRKALSWQYIVGQSCVRLIPIFYLYAIPDNIVFSKPDTNVLLLMLGWQWLQVFALKSQEVLGPRFFVREGWAPPAYDYHPVLREDEEEAFMPAGLVVPPDGSTTTNGKSSSSSSSSTIGSLVKTGEAREKGKRVFDCTICAQDIEVSIVPSSSGGSGGGSGSGGNGDDNSNSSSSSSSSSAQGLAVNILERRKYMVTPCRHIFHTSCLESWMRYRLLCPNCREALPPL